MGGGGGSSGGRFSDITHPEYRKKSQNRRYIDHKTGLTYEFHPAIKGEHGWRGKDHYHVENPNGNGKGNKYLDKNGNPCPDNSNESHLTLEEFLNLLKRGK